LGHDDLASVRDAADPRPLVHIEADVALANELGLSGVDSHPYRQRELCLCLISGSYRGSCRRKGDEERVALRIDLDAGVPLERPP
jgi:hypothetical protein